MAQAQRMHTQTNMERKGKKKQINGKCGLNFIIFRMVTETSPSLQLFSGSEMAFTSVFVYTAPVPFTNK